jgi:hypothetical protein
LFFVFILSVCYIWFPIDFPFAWGPYPIFFWSALDPVFSAAARTERSSGAPDFQLLSEQALPYPVSRSSFRSMLGEGARLGSFLINRRFFVLPTKPRTGFRRSAQVHHFHRSECAVRDRFYFGCSSLPCFPSRGAAVFYARACRDTRIFLLSLSQSVSVWCLSPVADFFAFILCFSVTRRACDFYSSSISVLVEAGLVVEPPDQRLKFSSFSSCFAHGFCVTHMR